MLMAVLGAKLAKPVTSTCRIVRKELLPVALIGPHAAVPDAEIRTGETSPPSMSIVPELAAMDTPLVILMSVPASTVSFRPLAIVTELVTKTGFIAAVQTVLLV